MNLSKSKREQLRMKFGGFCAYCGCELPERGWHADHVDPVLREWWKDAEWRRANATVCRFDHEKKELVSRPATKDELTANLGRPDNDTLDNLFPACPSCNIDKHAMSLEGWRRVLANKVNVCRYDSAFRHAERFGLIEITNKPVVFWFEKYAPQRPTEATR